MKDDARPVRISEALSRLKHERPVAALALACIALAIPVYAFASYPGMGEIDWTRWFAIHLLIAELAVVALAFLSGFSPKRAWMTLPRRMQLVIGGWIAVSTVATAFSPFASFSLVFQGAWVVHGLFGIALWFQLRERWAPIRSLILPLFAIGLLFHSLAAYLVVWFWYGPDLIDWAPYMVGTNNPRMYVFYADALLGLGLGFLIVAKRPFQFVCAIGLTFAAFHLFAWSGGRSAFGVAMLVTALVGAMARGHRVRLLLGGYGCAAVALPLTLFTAPSHPNFGMNSIVGRLSENTGQTDYSSGRLQFWQAFIEQGFEKPIFGHGQIGSLALPREVVEKAGLAIDPHNAIVHIFHAWGLAGLAIFAIALVPFLRTIPNRLDRYPTLAWPSFIGLLALAVTGALDGTLFFNQPLFFAALFLAILGSVATSNDISSSSEKSPAD